MKNTNLQKKWFNFCKPTELEHYSYSFTETELHQFPEGRAVLCEVKKKNRLLRQLRKDIGSIAANMRKTMDSLVFKVINAD